PKVWTADRKCLRKSRAPDAQEKNQTLPAAPAQSSGAHPHTLGPAALRSPQEFAPARRRRTPGSRPEQFPLEKSSPKISAVRHVAFFPLLFRLTDKTLSSCEPRDLPKKRSARLTICAPDFLVRPAVIVLLKS